MARETTLKVLFIIEELEVKSGEPVRLHGVPAP